MMLIYNVRSNIYLRLYALNQLSIVLGPSVAAGLMHINAWLALLVGLSLQALCIPIAVAVPETLDWSVRSDTPCDAHDTEPLKSTRETIRNIFTAAGLALHGFKSIWTQWQLIVLVGLCPFRIMMSALSDLLQRYVSDRYNWTLANATFLYSLQGVVSTLVLFVFLPFLADRIENDFDLNAIEKNVLISRVSLCLLVLAYAIQGLAPIILLFILGLIIQSLGLGLGPALRALTGALIERKHSAQMFSLIAITETLARMLMYPMVTYLFNVGLEKGPIWLGIPFDVGAAMALLALVPLSVVKFGSPSATEAHDNR